MHRVLVLIAFGLALVAGVAYAESDRYDPITDPNVQSYLVCIQLSSGGGENGVDASAFDNVGYVQWANGTTKAIVCQDVDKS